MGRARFDEGVQAIATGDVEVLVTAATHGRLEVVRMLLDAGADPNRAVSSQQTAPHSAATVGHAAVVELLLERGARTDIRERRFDRTPAEWARETDEGVLAASIEAVRAAQQGG